MCGEVVCFDQDFCEECCLLSEKLQSLFVRNADAQSRNVNVKSIRKEAEYKAVVAPFYYEGSVTRAILNMKMNEMPKLVDYQGKCVSDAVKNIIMMLLNSIL